MDCSGSMYRFQGVDGRLGRMLEATMLVMESLEGLCGKYEYCVKGHSGDDDNVEFVPWGEPPANRGERLKVLQRMVAHAQFCDSGDTTIEATRRAVAECRARSRSDGGENAGGPKGAVVVALSDANFRRYGMDPMWWADALTESDDVEAYAVMVGSLGDEASKVSRALPRGRGHVCADVHDLPVIFKNILEHARVIDDDDQE